MITDDPIVIDSIVVTDSVQIGTKFDVSVADESTPLGWVVTANPVNKTYIVHL